MFFGAVKFKGPEEEKGQELEEKPSEELKSSSTETFLKTPEAKSFIKKWTGEKKEGKQMYTRRGVAALVSSVFQIPGLGTNKAVLKESDNLLSLLGGMDGLQGFLAGWKAKSEGIIKGIKSLFKA